MVKNKNIIQSYLVTTAKYNLTIDEKRVLVHLVDIIQPLLEGKILKGKMELNLFDDYQVELPVSQFLPEFSTNHNRIKQALKLLFRKDFEHIDEQGNWKIIPLIGMPKFKKNGIVQFYLCKELVEVFLNFSKGFSKYQLEVSLKLNSVYSMRFYELLANHTQPITYNIDYLKQIFGATSPAYNKNSNFIERIIKPSKKELDEKANWSFEYTPIREGRRFTKVMFNPVHNIKNEDAEVYESELIKQINLTHLIENQVKNYLLNICHFSVKEVKNNIQTLQRFSEIYKANTLQKLQDIWSRASEKMNPKAYLIGSIKCEIENI